MKHALKRLRGCAVLVGALALMPLASQPSQAAGASCLPASLKHTLAQVRAKFGPVQVVSAHRPGARIAGSGKRSYHASCRAVDFNPPRGKHAQVVAWLRQNHNGGLGTYSCGMHHIHIDNGPHVRFHKCQGSGSRYASRGAKAKRYVHRSTRRATARTSRGYRSAEARPVHMRTGSGTEVAQYMQRSLSQ